jgi:hypothetical protein
MHRAAASNLPGTVEKIVKPMIQGEADLNSTCAWHRKTQGGQLESIKGQPASGSTGMEIPNEGSGTA